MKIANLLITIVLAAIASSAAAQYPTKPIRIVTPTPPGSAADTVARILGQSISQAVGQSVIVEAKAGADGAIAGMEVVKAQPDGYTLLLGTGGPIASLTALRKVPPYDPINDLTPIVDVGRFTLFLYAHPSVPANTLAELVAYAKARPGVLSYASGNVSGIVTFAQMNMLAGGLEMLHVPYKGEGGGITDLVAGRVHLMWATPTIGLSQVRAGKLRVLATQLKQRSKLLPNVPTIGEAGLPTFSITSFAAIYGPAKLPRDLVDWINKEFVAAMKRPDVIAGMENQAFVLNPGTPEELARLTKEQVDEFGRMLRQVGIHPE